MAISAQQFSGPIPPPEALRQYEQITPGLAERIIKWSENESEHRRQQEKLQLSTDIKVVKTQNLEIILGQIFGLVIGLAALAAGSYCAVNGAELAGSVIGGGGIIGLVTAFIAGRKGKSEQ